MTIQFKAHDNDKKDTIVKPYIEFSYDDGYYNATIYYDHVAIAYFNNDTGGISLIDFETGPYVGKDNEEDVKYLKSKGVELQEEEGHALGFKLYRIRLG